MMDQQQANRIDWVLVALLTAVGLGLRLAYLLQVPPFLDEYSSMLTGLSILRTGGVPRLPSGVIYPSGSLFSYLEAAFIGFFGFSDAVARLPSLLVSALMLPVLFLVARAMLNRRVALLSVALLALAPEAIVWGGRARMYSLLQLLVLLAVYFFYRSVLASAQSKDLREDPQAVSQAELPAWPWVLCFIAAIFAQDEAILLLPLFWLAALVAFGPRWFLRPDVLLGQVLLPVTGVGARYWLNEIRVPGEVYTLTHDAFFRFPPDLAHGLQRIAPFFTAPWAWPLALLFLIALFFVVKQQANLLPGTNTKQHPTPNTQPRIPIIAPLFLAYVVLSIAAALVLVVNTPWQNARYLFMVLPLFLMVASWGLEQVLTLSARRWPALQSQWVTVALVAVVTLLALPGGLSALRRFEPDYSTAYRWLAPQLEDGDLVATMRPAPAAVYLGRADLLVAEDKHQEFIMRLDGQWVDRWTGASVLESPEAFRDEALQSGRRVWFVIDEDRFESAAYSPEFVALILSQMKLVWRQGGVLVFQGQGYRPPPDMAVTRELDANFGDQLRLTGYALSTLYPQPGQEVTLQLYWQAIHPERNYAVFVHVVGTDGRGLTQVDGVPFLGLYDMTTHWPRDRAVVDERYITIPAGTPPGRYRLQVGLYDPDDLDSEPLPLAPTGETSLTLDFFHVNPPPLPEPSQPVAQGNLGDRVRLVGYDLLQTAAAAGTSLPLTLTWECLATMDADYTVFVHLVDNDNRPLAQADGQPLGGAYPTSFWNVGERVVDPRLLALPGDVPPGEYELLTGIYLLATGDRLPLLDENGLVLGDSISLGHITVTVP
jgi:4-amino-4-deoxy-L-arabinose transferase-like glycosyltransferase